LAANGTGAGSTKIARASLVDTVADHLRRDLVTGGIPPGEPIRVAPLEERFGVSHIPIREALRQLEAEGLVVSMPQRGAVAASVSLEEIGEIWDLRRLLEGQVVNRAARAATDADREAVREAVEAMRVEAEADINSLTFRESHTAFHRALVAPGSTRWIQDVLDRLWQGSERYIGLFTSFFPLVYDEFMKGHYELVEVFGEGDGDAMEKLLIEHIGHTEVDVREGYARATEAEPSSVS
jgi:DNA-binding GntR family transcriptional regulator